MNNTVDAKTFVVICQQALARYKRTGLLSESAGSIAAAWPDDAEHPMLHEIHDAALDIDEEHRSEAENQWNWQRITELLPQYQDGVWSATCWRLSIAYGLYENEIFQQHSFTAIVTRCNGASHVFSAEPELQQALAVIVDKVQPLQTDEWYLRNVAYLLPERIGKFRLMGSHAVQDAA